MKVRAKNLQVQKSIEHPTGGAFRSDGTAEWPADTYTFRRLQDGDITADDVGSDPPSLHEPAQTPPVASPTPAEPKKAKKES